MVCELIDQISNQNKIKNRCKQFEGEIVGKYEQKCQELEAKIGKAKDKEELKVIMKEVKVLKDGLIWMSKDIKESVEEKINEIKSNY